MDEVIVVPGFKPKNPSKTHQAAKATAPAQTEQTNTKPLPTTEDQLAAARAAMQEAGTIAPVDYPPQVDRAKSRGWGNPFRSLSSQ